MGAGATARPGSDEADDDDDLLRGAIFFSPIFIGTTIGTIFLREATLLRDITGEADGDADALDNLADFDAECVTLADALFSFHASYFFLVFSLIFLIPFLNP